MSLVPYKVTAIKKTDPTGNNVLPLASVAIVKSGGGYAQLWDDEAGTTPRANPFQVDSNGERQVWILGGEYSVSVSGGQSWDIKLTGGSDILSIENVAALSTFTPVAGQAYCLKEYNSGTGKGGSDLIGKVGVITPNNVTTFACTSGTYVERINVPSPMPVEFAGADLSIADNTIRIQAAIDAANQIILSDGDWVVSHLKLRSQGAAIYGASKNARLISNQDFTTLHTPTVWVIANDCHIKNVGFGYVGWSDTNYTSFQTARPDGNSWYGAHISVGYTELYTSVSSGVYNTFNGELLQVVYNTKITDVSIHGTALHAVSLMNAVGTLVSGGNIEQYKGTGVYGFIAPKTTVKGVNFEASRDDAVYIGGSDAHMNGVWTPLTTGDLLDIKILNNRSIKCGAKVYSASGYNGVLINGNWSAYSRTSAFYTASEASQGVSASRNVKICNNIMLETFGGYGLASQGFGYTTSIVDAVGGNHYAVDISDCDGVEYLNNTVIRTVATSAAGFRGFWGGAGNPKNVKSARNKWIGFVRNNCGLEISDVPVCENIEISDSFVGYSGESAVRFIHTGVNSKNIVIDGCDFTSSAVSGASWAAVWLGAGSNVAILNIETNLTGGLAIYNDSEGSASLTIDGVFEYDKNATRPKSVASTVRWGSDAPASGSWVIGDEVRNPTPTIARNISHWKCLATGSSGQWAAYGCGTGTTAQRPALTSRDLGYLYKDTTTGTLIFWNGSSWI